MSFQVITVIILLLGFAVVIYFLNRRPKAEILEVLRSRIDRPADDELDTALAELVSIAEDRWRRG